MVGINTQGLDVATLSTEQITVLNNAQAEMNRLAKINEEIYLLAVTRGE